MPVKFGIIPLPAPFKFRFPQSNSADAAPRKKPAALRGSAQKAAAKKVAEGASKMTRSVTHYQKTAAAKVGTAARQSKKISNPKLKTPG